MSGSVANENNSFRQRTKQSFSDAGRALLLQDDVYTPYLEKENPFRFGCGTLTLLLLPAAIAIGVGVAMDLLTLPRADILQEQLINFITHTNVYLSLVNQAPVFAELFNIFYNVTWWGIRTTGVYPFPVSIILAPISFILGILFNWWLYSVLVQMVAGWLGGKSRKGVIYSPLVFAFAPQMINILAFIPGLTIPAYLLLAWTIAISYQVIRATYGFTWGRSVMTIILTLVMNFVLITLAVIFGVLIGVLVAKGMT
jgi:hypothetical protein